MALSNSNNKLSFSPEEPTTAYLFNIPYFATADITVTVLKSGETAETILSYAASPANDGQFKVDATNGNPSDGATITIGGSGYGSGDKVTIERIVAVTQEYDLQEGSSIDPTALNKAFDRAIAQNQQQQDSLDTMITFPNTDTSITYKISESPTSRANKILGFDGSGNVNAQTISSVAGSAVTGGDGIDITANQVTVDVTSDFSFNSGELQLAANSVDTSEIVDSAVTEAKIGNNAVTSSKIAGNAVGSAQISDGAVGSSELAGNAVSLPTMAQIATKHIIGRTTAGTGNPEHIPFSGRIQRLIVEDTGSTLTTTASIPYDTTLPTSSEGYEIATVNVTPTSTSNKLKMNFSFIWTTTQAQDRMMVCFFEGTTCKRTFHLMTPVGNAGVSVGNPVTHNWFNGDFEFTPSGTSQVAYSVRVGAIDGDGTSTTLTWYNSQNGTHFGNTLASPTLVVEEWIV